MMNVKALKTFALMMLAEIVAHGETGVPSGHLYAKWMGKLSFAEYGMVEEVLTSAKWVKITNNLIVATPEGKEIGERVAKTLAEHPKLAPLRAG